MDCIQFAILLPEWYLVQAIADCNVVYCMPSVILVSEQNTWYKPPLSFYYHVHVNDGIFLTIL